MSGLRFIAREQLEEWLDDIAQAQTLFAPREVAGVLLYRPVKQSSEIAWGGTRPVLSIKEVFFPPTESLFLIQKTGQQIDLFETLPEEKQVVFGVRPCDARGMQVLDALFTETQPVDPYYNQRRMNTTLIGLACPEMGESCFCTSMGGAPDDPTGLDLLLTAVDGGFAVEIVTEKGQAVLRGLRLSRFYGALPEPKRKEAIPVPIKSLWPAHFQDGYWQDMAERCLSCRACAYVCPTCRCFDIRDETLSPAASASRFERIRCWDSCAGEAYRRIAGGHNPRDAKGERLRNRFYCKFDYYPEQYGPVACTGCGRCIDVCPVNIDITEVLQQMAEVSR
jgi:ferredoxin